MSEGWSIPSGIGPWILESVKVIGTTAITIFTFKEGRSLIPFVGSDQERMDKYNENLANRIKSIYDAFPRKNG